ncbi:MAG: hypothetical protein AB7G13_31155 [Lautropia sp.]
MELDHDTVLRRVVAAAGAVVAEVDLAATGGEAERRGRGERRGQALQRAGESGQADSRT